MTKLNMKKIVYDVILRVSLPLAFATFSVRGLGLETVTSLPLWMQAR